MKHFQNIVRLLAVCCLLATGAANAQEEINIAFSYQGDHGTDFSKLRVSLSIGEFTDNRGLDNPKLITGAAIAGASNGYQAERPLAEVVRDAIIQGFESGGAELAEEDADMQIVGSIETVQLQQIERNGVPSLQLIMRTRVQLQGNGRTVFQNTLFGRGIVPIEDGVAAAMAAALDRTINELAIDDYFLMEVI